MRKNIFRVISVILAAMLLCIGSVPAFAVEEGALASAPTVDCRSVVLMEAGTGRVLYESNADEALPPASVTKIMTLLLVMEAIDEGRLKYEDMITASAHACSMGGSQIYLKEGEQMTAEDMIKSVVIASANDAAVALAEHICGSESAFVEKMNTRALELGMKNTNFENTNGLDDTAQNHVTSARDIAIMSRELIRHKKILDYSSIWMDTIRNGEFGLTNTNRLVRFYKGATGLKTGSTSKAGFCISATAERDGMSLICVIMGASTRDIRNAAATAMLDWGFASFGCYTSPEIKLDSISVKGGSKAKCTLEVEKFSTVADKDSLSKVEHKIELPENLSAPIKKGTKIGSVKYTSGGQEIGSADIIAAENVDKINYFDMLIKILSIILLN